MLKLIVNSQQPNIHEVRDIFKCSVKSYVTGPSTKCYFKEFLFMRVLMHDKLEQTNSCERSECHDFLMVLCLTYLQEVVFENNPSDYEA
jgi:hypothetical protein